MLSDAIYQAYLGMKDRYPDLSFKQVQNCFSTWEIDPIIKDNHAIGAVFIKDNEIHISVNKEFKGRWLTRDLWHRTINRIIKQYGEVKTTAMKDSKNSQNFIERCGFKNVGEINNCFIYTMKEIKYE